MGMLNKGVSDKYKSSLDLKEMKKKYQGSDKASLNGFSSSLKDQLAQSKKEMQAKK